MAYGNTSGDGTGDFWHLLVNGSGNLIVSPIWTPSLQADENLNDSDKAFTVPASTEWIVKWLWIELTTDGTVGNRQLEIEIQDDAADIIAEVRLGQVQGASLTRYYLLAPHVTELTAFRDADYLSTIMPEWHLPASYVVRVYDNNVVSAAGDDMILQMMVLSRSVA